MKIDSCFGTLTAFSWGLARYALDLFKEAGMVGEVKSNKDCIAEQAVDKLKWIISDSSIIEIQVIPTDCYGQFTDSSRTV